MATGRWNKIGCFLAALACLYGIGFVLFGFAAHAQDLTGAASSPRRRTVRVIMSDAESGSSRTDAFIKDYLQAVKEYANWDYVYIDASWADGLEMVKNGQADLMPDVSKTEERLAGFDYSSESMGTEMSYLFGRSGTLLHYDDAVGFDGMTVGYEKGSTIIDSMRTYGKQSGFHFQEKAYDTSAEMFAALDAGAVDTVVQSSFYDTPPGHVILAKFNPSPVYLITSKTDPSLKIALDNAMAQLISYNPSFNTELFQYHFGDITAQSVGYNQEELEYLAKKPVVDVLYEKNWEPFEFAQDGEAQGITPDIIRTIGEQTGIQFRFVLSASTQDIYEGMGGASSDSIMAVSYDYAWASTHGLLVTQPYLNGSVMLVKRRAGDEIRTVATVQGSYLENQIRRKYPDYQTIAYANNNACMEAVRKGEANGTFLNYYQANYYRTMDSYEDFSYQPDANITQGIALGVTRGSNPVLIGILSKALQQLSANKIQGILSENAARADRLSIRRAIRRYPVQFGLLVGGMGTLLGLLVVLLITSDVRRRQNIRLAGAKQDAEAANNAKSEFLSRMSHDMRTPLNGIIGMTYITAQMDLPPPARENLNKIDTSSKFLLNLINDLLDMTKAEKGKIVLQPEPYPPEDFNRYIDAVIRPLCESKNQTLTVDLAVTTDFVPMLDKLRMNQILFNLLSNAVKYTPEGGKICFRAKNVMMDDNRMSLCLTVEDNGIGMSEAFQKVLFTPFTQEGRNDNSDLRGSGLGLAITRQLVELMHGAISVKSKIGEGSTLTVRLQADAAARQPEKLPCEMSEESNADALLAGKHILLCEDHPLNQEIAKTILAQKHLVVELADDGQRGINAFARSAVGYYDAVLMDIRMPVVDGYAATRAIRTLNRPDAKTVPILAMSADVLTEDIQKCRAAGMDGHIAKPIDPKALYSSLAEAIANRKKS